MYNRQFKPTCTLQACILDVVHHSLQNTTTYHHGMNHYTHMPSKLRTSIVKVMFVQELWLSDPGTDPIGFVSKFTTSLWYLCVHGSDVDPELTEITFWAPLPTNKLKECSKLAGTSLNTRHSSSFCAKLYNTSPWD